MLRKTQLNTTTDVKTKNGSSQGQVLDTPFKLDTASDFDYD